MGRWLIFTGISLVVIGVILHLFPGVVSWFGRLPGDIRIGNGRVRVWLPLASMLILSLLITLLLNFFRR